MTDSAMGLKPVVRESQPGWMQKGWLMPAERRNEDAERCQHLDEPEQRRSSTCLSREGR
ncbi:hypothetical protein [Variovorax sp. E3]|uniref:hypothetical protein n=1 Tax=Variovorax sp. E3 TaxID=1914993 RepID=UPI0018DE62F9|nr:hypothetical protein [Variovorax sp. E3]